MPYQVDYFDDVAWVEPGKGHLICGGDARPDVIDVGPWSPPAPKNPGLDWTTLGLPAVDRREKISVTAGINDEQAYDHHGVKRRRSHKAEAARERFAAVVAAYKEGEHNAGVLAERFGMSRDNVNKALVKYGARPKLVGPVSEADSDRVLWLWRDGLTNVEIAAETGIPRGTIYGILKRAGAR